MFIIVFLLLIFAETTTFAVNKQPLARVQDFQGDVVVLRNPVRQKSPEFDQRVSTRLHQVSFYMGWYWEAYPMNHQTQLSYGDLISTGAQSSAQIKIQSVHEIRLAENSAVQLVPDFMKLLLTQGAHPSVYIIAGKMRIKVNPGPNFSSFTARSSSMVADLKRSDFLLAAKGKISQAISLDGDISVRRVSKANQQLYLQSLEHYRSRNFKELSRLTAQRQKKLEEKPIVLAVGSKLETWEALNAQDLENLDRLLGAEKTKAYLETAARMETTPIREEDLDYFSGLLPDIEMLMDKMEFANISDDEMEEGLGRELQTVEESGKTETRMTRDEALFNFISLHLGYANIVNEFNKLYSFEGRSLALELEIRPWNYMYSYLTISSGVADTENMANFLGQGPPQPLNAYSHWALGLGGRVVIWKHLALSVGVGIINIQKLSIQYDDLPSNVNRTYTVMLDPIPIAELGMALNFVGDMELFIRYGLGSSFASVEAKDIADDFKSSGSFSYGTVGLGWNTQ